MNYIVRNSDNVLSTIGIREHGYPEVSLRLKPEDNTKTAEVLLRIIGDYMIGQSVSLRSGETFGFGSWTVKLLSDEKGELWIHEYVANSDDYIDGASFAIGLWDRQEVVCKKNDVSCLRPSSTQLVVISEGVLEGDPVEAVRYNSPEHMSGWWITTDRYNDDSKTLKPTHLMHVLQARPEIGEWIGLPYGFRFDKNGMVSFDQSVADQLTT